MTDPALKYADRVSPEHRAAMDLATGAYHTLKMVEPQLRKLDEAERRSHSFGHILDPTFYRDQINSQSFADQMTFIRAALAFIDKVDTLRSNIAERQGHDHHNA